MPGYQQPPPYSCSTISLQRPWASASRGPGRLHQSIHQLQSVPQRLSCPCLKPALSSESSTDSKGLSIQQRAGSFVRTRLPALQDALTPYTSSMTTMDHGNHLTCRLYSPNLSLSLGHGLHGCSDLQAALNTHRGQADPENSCGAVSLWNTYGSLLVPLGRGQGQICWVW